MVIIMEEILWKMFKKTGDIKYYLFLKQLGSDTLESRKDRRNNNR